MNEEYLQTERLTLRKVDPERLGRLFAGQDTEEIMEFFGLESKDLAQKEQEKYLMGLRTFNRSYLYFHLIDTLSKTLVGWCGYHTWYIDHNRAEIGYGLFKENLKRQGLMTEVLQAVLSYGFDKMGLYRVEAMVGEDNVPSLKLLDKFGFKKEGVLREHYLVDSVMEDSLVFGLLKSEFED